MRPVGGALVGYIGDKVGRRAALTFSVTAMAIPTFLSGNRGESVAYKSIKQGCFRGPRTTCRVSVNIRARARHPPDTSRR